MYEQLDMYEQFLDFATYIILTRNLTLYPKYQIYTLTSPLQHFSRRILY